MSSKQETLYSSEWIMVLSFLILLGSCAAVAFCHQHRKFSQVQRLEASSQKRISITIEGAVEKPGVYSVVPGTPLREVLRKSRPNRFASLRGLNLDLPLESDLSFCFAELSSLRIRIAGALAEPVDLEVPAGTRLCQLRSKVTCLSSADRNFFKSRRLLKDGEELRVPETVQETPS